MENLKEMVVKAGEKCLEFIKEYWIPFSVGFILGILI